MEQMTITEALSEINLIKKKVESKKSEIKPYLTRTTITEDPIKTEGGSAEKIKREMQAIFDLSRRLERIRFAVADANLKNTIKLGDVTKSIHDWLTWKREIYKDQVEFVSDVLNTARKENEKFNKQPIPYRDEKTNEPTFAKLVLNVDLDKLAASQQALQETFEKLDGQLSLKNATITVTLN